MDVGVVDQGVDERHARRARAHHEVVGLRQSHRHGVRPHPRSTRVAATGTLRGPDPAAPGFDRSARLRSAALGLPEGHTLEAAEVVGRGRAGSGRCADATAARRRRRGSRRTPIRARPSPRVRSGRRDCRSWSRAARISASSVPTRPRIAGVPGIASDLDEGRDDRRRARRRGTRGGRRAPARTPWSPLVAARPSPRAASGAGSRRGWSRAIVAVVPGSRTRVIVTAQSVTFQPWRPWRRVSRTVRAMTARNASTVSNTCIGISPTLTSRVKVTPELGRERRDGQPDRREERSGRRPVARDRLDRRCSHGGAARRRAA